MSAPSRAREILGTLPLDLAYLFTGLVFGPVYLVLRRLKGKDGMALGRRFRPDFAPLPEGGIWVHAVSVGETLAVRPLVEELRRRHPELPIVLTATTRTGRAVGSDAFRDLPVVPTPLDFGPSLRRFLDRARPKLSVLVELELWPNHLKLCRLRGIPVVVVNARLSERSARGYRRLLKIAPRFLDGIRGFLLQEEHHLPAFRSLGVEDERLPVVGNLKYDGVHFRDPAETRAALRAEHGIPDDAPILLAGSTHPGEELPVLEAFRALRKRRPDARLVLAPRHPERVKEVLALGREGTERWALRSRPGEVPDPEVLLVDTLGELARLFAMAEVVFLGGSLVPIGGHNLMEPASWGRPLVTGPHLHTVQSMAAAFQRAGALQVVDSPQQLSEAVIAILDDENAVERARRGAERVVAAHEGSLSRSLEALSRWVAAES